MVGFGGEMRLLGESAKTNEIKQFKFTISSLKRLIGLSYSEIELEKEFINCKLIKSEENEVMVEVYYQNETQLFTFTQLCGILINI